MNDSIKSALPKILITESEPLIRKYIFSCIQPLDWFDIYEAENPVEALNLVEDHRPLVIIFDLKHWPDKALNLINQARQLSSNYLPYFVALSAVKDDRSILEAYKGGADYFLPKNFSRHELTGILHNILRLSDFMEKLEIKEQHYRTIFQTARDPLFLIRADDFSVIDFNESAASVFKQFDINRDSVRFTDFFIDPENVSRMIKTRITYASLLRTQAKNGSSIPLAASFNYFEAQDLVLISLKDLTLEMRLHEEKSALSAIRNFTEDESSYKETIAFLTGEENERRRISQEIHDHIGQLMVAVKLRIESIILNFDQVKKEDVVDVRDQLINAVSALRMLSAEVASDTLPGSNLLKSIQMLLNNFISKHSLKISSELPRRLPELSSFVQTNFYRIIEESLMNIVKHASSPDVVFRITTDNTHVYLFVQNQGDFRTNRPGMGLRIMQQRALLIGGELYFESDVNAQFMLNFRIAYQKIDSF